MAGLDKAELRALKREHKHIQKSIQRELSDRGGRRVEDRPHRVLATLARSRMLEPTSRHAMRGVKEAVRHILRDLK